MSGLETVRSRIVVKKLEDPDWWVVAVSNCALQEISNNVVRCVSDMAK